MKKLPIVFFALMISGSVFANELKGVGQDFSQPVGGDTGPCCEKGDCPNLKPCIGFHKGGRSGGKDIPTARAKSAGAGKGKVSSQ